MSDQWTHIHIFLRQHMMGGTLFERCICGRARSPVMTGEQSIQAELASGRTMAAVMVGHFRRVYGHSVVERLPSPPSLLRRLNSSVRPASCEVPPALMAEAMAHGAKYV